MRSRSSSRAGCRFSPWPARARLDPSITGYTYEAVIGAQGGLLASAMFLLFAVASITPACFCAFIAGNSFSTMIPGVPRMSSTMAGVTVAIILAITGAAANLVQVFVIVGASFGPICGAMVADYYLSGKEWSGPRQGINWAGYVAWALGFAVGIWSPYQPAVLYSFFVGLVVYAGAGEGGVAAGGGADQGKGRGAVARSQSSVRR